MLLSCPSSVSQSKVPLVIFSQLSSAHFVRLAPKTEWVAVLLCGWGNRTEDINRAKSSKNTDRILFRPEMEMLSGQLVNYLHWRRGTWRMGEPFAENIILSKWENQYTTQRVLGFCFHRTDRQIDKAHFVSLVRAKTTIPCAHYDNPILSSAEEEEEEDWGFGRRWGGGSSGSSSSWYRLTENVERRPQRRWRRKSSYRNGK